MAHCEFCGEETDNDNLEEIDGAIVRVCDNCRNNPSFGGEFYARQIEASSDKPVEQPKQLEHHSFNPNASWLEKLNQIKKQSDTAASIDDKKLYETYKQLEFYTQIKKKAEEHIQEIMEERGITSLKTNYFTISYTPEHMTTKFDQTAFKKEHSDLFDQFQKRSPVKASVRITLKKEKKGEEEK